MPVDLESLAQSVLVEAVRNARKHAAPTRVEVALSRQDGAWVMEVCNDGVRGRSRTISGMGLRLAALEALQVGGLSSSASASRARGGSDWRCRMSVPDVNPSRIASGSGDRKLRVLVVDDHEVVHWGLRLMLGEQPWVERCLSARNGEEAMALADPLLRRTSRWSTCSSDRSRAPRSASASGPRRRRRTCC